MGEEEGKDKKEEAELVQAKGEEEGKKERRRLSRGREGWLESGGGRKLQTGQVLPDDIQVNENTGRSS